MPRVKAVFADVEGEQDLFVFNNALVMCSGSGKQIRMIFFWFNSNGFNMLTCRTTVLDNHK